MLPIGSDWSRERFDGPFYLSRAPAARPSCSLVFVQSADGNTGAARPADLGGGSTDEHLIYEGLSRVAADAGRAVSLVAEAGHPVDHPTALPHPEGEYLKVSLLRA